MWRAVKTMGSKPSTNWSQCSNCQPIGGQARIKCLTFYGERTDESLETAFCLLHFAFCCWKEHLKELVIIGITALKSIGLKITAMVCDQGSNNRGMSTLLKVTLEKTYFFYHNDEKIYFIWDTPNFLKMSETISWSTIFFGEEQQEVSWNVIKDFYEKDKAFNKFHKNI